MEGYVRLWRKIMNEPFYTNSKYYHLATHLILNANHKENIITFNNQEITIKRGQLITGTYRISELTGCTRQGIRSGLKYLERVKFITIKTTNKYSLITVNKYEEYQGNQPTKQPTDNQQITNKQPTDNQQITTNNNDKNDKNDKNKQLLYIFERLWTRYPRPLGKKQAFKHFVASVRTWQDYKQIKVALINYVNESKGKDIEYVKHGSSWFNNWRDYINTNKEQNKTQKTTYLNMGA